MPKLGSEPIRRQALVNAAIAEVGAHGLDVTVARIARQAGMSPALAHHYFGGKAQMFEGAMRQILADHGRAVRHGLATDRDRLRAIVAASFGTENFRPLTISAWLVFYVEAQKADWARRLLRVYQARLRANLRHALRSEGHPGAAEAAEIVAALIDGTYLRAVSEPGFDGAQAVARILAVGRAAR